jgi:FtsH-binding integral membrane protein
MPNSLPSATVHAERGPHALRPAMSVAAAPSRGRLQPLSRAGVVLLLVLAVANGAFLYLVPTYAATHYAWLIVPPINAAFLGAGFLAGTVATALVVFGTERWRSLRTLAPPLFVLAGMLLAATIIHADRLRWDYPPTWGWTAVYAAVPLAVAFLWRRQERNAEPTPAPDRALRTVRALSAGLGGLLVAFAAPLFVSPTDLAELWPWQLTPLLARAVASWFAMIGVMLLACAWSMRRPNEAIIPYATLLAWSLLLLLLPLLHGQDIVRDGVELTVWSAVMVALVLLSLLALFRAVPAARADGRHL